MKIKLGLPKGSLNTKGRGNTREVFIDAGYDIQGYESGNESDKRLSIVNDPEIEARLTRPQSAPVELSRRLLDIAIIGEDWVREEDTFREKPNVRKIGDLEYGQTRLVAAVPENAAYESLSDFFLRETDRKNPILCFTEYVNLTRQKFMENKEYRKIFGNKKPVIQIRSIIDGDNDRVVIMNSDGVTEGYIAKGADIIVDTTQTGSRLKEYDLRELEEIMKSSAGLYAGPSCTGWKQGKANEIYRLLKGAVDGKNYFDVKFNIPNQQLENIRNYLIGEQLCSDEPTILKGEEYSAINILIPRNRFPKTLRTLIKKYQASAIVRNEVKQFVD